MKIIAVNAGSSSLKFQLLTMPEEHEITSGLVERIGYDNAVFIIKVNGEKVKKELPIYNHKTAVELVVKGLLEHKIIDSIKDINGVGHRVVQGGEKFKDSVVITDEVIKDIISLNDLAPLIILQILQVLKHSKNCCQMWFKSQYLIRLSIKQ